MNGKISSGVLSASLLQAGCLDWKVVSPTFRPNLSRWFSSFGTWCEPITQYIDRTAAPYARPMPTVLQSRFLLVNIQHLFGQETLLRKCPTSAMVLVKSPVALLHFFYFSWYFPHDSQIPLNSFMTFFAKRCSAQYISPYLTIDFAINSRSLVVLPQISWSNLSSLRCELRAPHVFTGGLAGRHLQPGAGGRGHAAGEGRGWVVQLDFREAVFHWGDSTHRYRMGPPVDSVNRCLISVTKNGRYFTNELLGVISWFINQLIFGGPHLVWGFPRMGVPQKWMVSKFPMEKNPWKNWWFGGAPHFRKPPYGINMD